MILVIGSYNVDYFVVVEDLPKPGETVRAIRTFSAHGGKGSNQAVSARRLKGDVALVSAVGDDSSGKTALEFWRNEGLEVKWVKVKTGIPTGKAIILVDVRGRNMIAVEPGANYALKPEDVRDSLEWGNVLLTQLEIPEETVKYALSEFDGLKILNPAPARLRDYSVLELADILTPNEVEATELAGTNEVSLAAERLAKKSRLATVVTLGDRGVLVVTREGKRFRFDALKVEPVDETGAGDVFNAALAVFLDKGLELEEAVRRANAIAGISVTSYGALGPTWEEVERFMHTTGSRLFEP
ncbi:MAG: ribokinase [Sulfolobales archaeon]|nr:ribokinase [Sulfolobales archaeon]